MAAQLPYRIFDCDTHVTEQEDAFTRYIEPKFRQRAITFPPRHLHEARLDGEPLNESRSMPEDSTLRPGSLKEMLQLLTFAK